MAILSTNKRLFKISFRNTTEEFIFQEWEDIAKIVKSARFKGMFAGLKEYDTNKEKFKRMSKAEILRNLDFNNTELFLHFKNIL